MTEMEQERNQEQWLAHYRLKKGQIVLYKDNNYLRPVTISGIGTYLDEYDVLYAEELDGFITPADIYTKTQILAGFEKPGKQECEGCHNEIQWNLIHKNENEEYHLCSNCLVKINTNSLNKDEYQKILQSGHSDKEFLLHGDFYDEEGNALYPKKIVRVNQ